MYLAATLGVQLVRFNQTSPQQGNHFAADASCTTPTDARALRRASRLTCSFCGKMFKQRSHVTRHEMTHTGARPFACDFCGRRFSQRAHMKDHRRAKHNAL